MSFDSDVHIWIVTCVEDADVAWIIADESGDHEDDQGEEPAWFQGHHWQDEDQPSYHSIDHGNHGHRPWKTMIFFFAHLKNIISVNTEKELFKNEGGYIKKGEGD